MSLKSTPSPSIQLCLPSSTFWNTGLYLSWAQHQSWSQSLFKVHPPPNIADISGQYWHHWSNSGLHLDTTLTQVSSRLCTSWIDWLNEAGGVGIAVLPILEEVRKNLLKCQNRPKRMNEKHLQWASRENDDVYKKGSINPMSYEVMNKLKNQLKFWWRID